MAFVRILLVGVIGIVAINAVDPPETCDKPLGHYTELGCTPVYNEDSKCPERYDCPLMLARDNNQKCYYKSHVYNKGEKLEDDVNEHVCSVECLCNAGSGDRPEFLCAEIECPEDADRWSLPEEERCVYQYRMKDCCSYNTVCDKEEKAKLKTCTVEGKTYKEGERVFIKDGCKSCICDKSYNGDISSLNCQVTNCGVELYHRKEAKQGCAPVYYQNSHCCPIAWKCPEDGDDIKRSLQKVVNDDKKMKCKYGEKMLNIGDSVTSTSEKCVTCECSVPPLMGCTRAANC